jgi:hypothetical protein
MQDPIQIRAKVRTLALAIEGKTISYLVTNEKPLISGG